MYYRKDITTKKSGATDNQYNQTKDDEEMRDLKFELARIEAKIDILTTLVMRQEGASSANIQQPTTASEHALCRSMTVKQHVTLQQLILGRSNKEIADVIGIGENTVKLHVRAVCKKVGCKTRGQAAMIMSEVLERMDPTEYQRSSGGLPIDWAATLVPSQPDKYAALYRSEAA